MAPKSKKQPKPHKGPRVKPEGGKSSRALLKTVAEDTLQILQDDKDTQDATAATVTYLPGQLPVDFKVALVKTESGSSSAAQAAPAESPFIPCDITKPFPVWTMSTLAACKLLVDEGEKPCALNFASAKNPGGGFLRGSSAQEESLCRSSGLYYCIKDSPVYTINRTDNNRCLYAHTVIYSPMVPVIKADDGKPLEQPFTTSFLTCPAVNAGVAAKKSVSQAEIDTVMMERIDALLSVAAAHREKVLVLGAFGCGVFGNNPGTVARMFTKLLRGKYKDSFSRVVFAILGDDPIKAFKKVV